MKTTIIYGIVLGVGSLVSTFTWVPGAVDSTRDYMIAPALAEIKSQSAAQRIIMSGMKHFDIRTDELQDDVNRLKSSITGLEREIQETLDISAAHKRSLERQIESYKKELLKKGGMLDRATEVDQKILSELTGQSV